jgi:hypothetical protein
VGNLDRNPQTEEQANQSLNETKTRAAAFEELVRTKGWDYILTYIQNRLTLFTNTALGEGFKSMEQYQEHRGEVNGLRNLLGEVEETLRVGRTPKKTNEQPKDDEFA